MIDLSGCLALCHLSEEEVEAIAEHEHIPFIAAIELGDALSHTADGVLTVRRMILEDIVAARRRHDFGHSARLKVTLRQFIDSHPNAREIRVV